MPAAAVFTFSLAMLYRAQGALRHVGLAASHAEGNGGDDDINAAVGPVTLGPRARGAALAGVVCRYVQILTAAWISRGIVITGYCGFADASMVHLFHMRTS